LTYLLVLALVGTAVVPWLFIVVVIAMASLLVINRDTYRFFKARRGLRFAVLTIPWHWLYFFYSGLAFLIGFARFQIRNLGYWK